MTPNKRGPQPLSNGATPKPIDLVLDKLPGHRRSGKGWIARCPAHEDTKPSLSVAEGQDGRVLLTCHAGCSLGAICTAMGLKVADLHPSKDTIRPPSNGKMANRREVAAYDYRDENGALLYQVVRFEPKHFAQRRPDGNGGWVWNLKGVRRVLYRLPELLAVDSKSWVFVVEGEKDADRLAAFGLIATTNPGGAGNWSKADSSPLHGKRVVVLRDNDVTGATHQDDVARDLFGKSAEVRIVELPGLPTKGDVSDWLDSGHTVAELLDLVESTEPLKARPVPPAETRISSSPVLAWEPPIPFGHYDLPEFPMEAIPSQLCAICEFCAAVSESLQVPVDSVVMLVLSVCGSALAKRIEVYIHGDWIEPVNLYVVVVMESGERKSALFRLVSGPTADFEQQENERLAPLIEQYQAEMAMLAAEFKHVQGKAAKATKPDDRESYRRRVKELAKTIRTTKPVMPLQLTADDATPEAVGQLLHEQGGRIAMLSPEGDVFDLMGGRYSDGVGRLGVYLKGHAGDDYRLNRVTRANEYVRSPAITVGLAIQPDVLRGLIEKPGFRGRGLLARFLYSLPTSRVGFRRLNPGSVPPYVLANYARLVRSVLQLQPETDSNDKPRPYVVKVSNDAYSELNRFRGSIETELRPSGGLSALKDWGSKLPGAVCRIAGIFHGLIHTGKESLWEQPIDAETMVCAIAIGEYLIAHAKAAFCEMGANPATGVARRILVWATEGRLKVFSRRDAFIAVRGAVQRVEELDEPLHLLSEHGYIREQILEKSGAGRKPSTRFDVNPLTYAQNTQNAQNSGSAGHSAHSAQFAREIDS